MEHSQNKSHSLLTFISSFVLGLFLMGLSIFLFTKSNGGSDAASFQSLLNNLLKEDLFKIQILQQLSLFGLPVLFYAIFRRYNFYEINKIESFPNFILILWGIAFAIFAFPVLSFLSN